MGNHPTRIAEVGSIVFCPLAAGAGHSKPQYAVVIAVAKEGTGLQYTVAHGAKHLQGDEVEPHQLLIGDAKHLSIAGLVKPTRFNLLELSVLRSVQCVVVGAVPNEPRIQSDLAAAKAAADI